MIIVDRLTVGSLAWLTPAVFTRRADGAGRFYYFQASAAGRAVANLLARAGLASGCQLEYAFTDVRYPDGSCAGRRVTSTELAEVCGAVRRNRFEASPVVHAAGRRFARPRLLVYLEKCLAEELAPVLMQVVVAAWYRRTHAAEDPECLLYLASTPWHQEVRAWARRHHVVLRRYGAGWFPPVKPTEVFTRGLKLIGRWWTSRRADRAASTEGAKHSAAASAASRPPMVAVSYQGKGVSFDVSRNSDLFWVPAAGLTPSQILVYFTGADDPLDPEKFATLTQAGLQAIAMNPSARTHPDLPLWQSRTSARRLGQAAAHLLGRAATAPWDRGANCWIAWKLLEFTTRYNGWADCFEQFNVMLHVDYSDWAKERLCADEAVCARGGLAVSYQLADESTPAVPRARAVDVHLGFSTALVEIERQSHSSLTQFVAVGYVRDYAFRHVRERAQRLREQVAARGAQFIVTFLDENSSPDKRRAPAYAERAEDYRFLLERLLADPYFGLICKPKKPLTLRRRLGPVAALLEQALATGRCVLFEEGAVATPVLPCEASQAADVTIGLLFGTSAALESALAGTPTILIDREGLLFNPLYALGEGRVIFRSWDRLWQALSAYRADRAAVPEFGDWHPMLDQLDPFHDGRAAERFGEYVGSLSRGLAEGLTRAQALAAAREHYALRWGAQHVVDFERTGSGALPAAVGEPAVQELIHAG